MWCAYFVLGEELSGFRRKRNEKILSIALVFVIGGLMLVSLAGCGSSASQGLEFESNGDGMCVWTGIGSCSDTEIRSLDEEVRIFP